MRWIAWIFRWWSSPRGSRDSTSPAPFHELSESPFDSKTLPLGDTIDGKFRLVDIELGIGGFGTVQLAVELALNRLVALKTPHLADKTEAQKKDFLRRFEVEAKILASLNDPRIVTVYGLYHATDSRHFIYTEFVSGRDLEELRNEAPLSPADACALIRDVALGLRSAHKRLILHRDIKPLNVMVPDRQDEDTPKVKIIDFGLAKRIAGEFVVKSEHTPGTLFYMAPELLRGEDASISSDIYALGLTLAALVCGRDFPAANRYAESDYPIELFPSFDGRMRALVRRCTDGEPANRFQSTTELIDAIDGLGRRTLMPPLVRRIPVYAAVLFLLVYALSSWTNDRATQPGLPPNGDPPAVLDGRATEEGLSAENGSAGPAGASPSNGSEAPPETERPAAVPEPVASAPPTRAETTTQAPVRGNGLRIEAVDEAGALPSEHTRYAALLLSERLCQGELECVEGSDKSPALLLRVRARVEQQTAVDAVRLKWTVASLALELLSPPGQRIRSISGSGVARTVSALEGSERAIRNAIDSSIEEVSIAIRAETQ